MGPEALERLLERLQQAGLIGTEQSWVKPTADGWWAFDRDAPQARIPEVPLHEYLRWILEQLNYGQYDLLADGPGGKAESIVIGKQAADSSVTQRELIEHCQKRGLAIGLSGIVAEAREGGTVAEFKPQVDYHTALVEYVGAADAESNTDMYYARQLVEALERVRQTTFRLSAVPIVGRVPQHAQRLLKEATRCYFFGLELGCFALCRANLESSLYARVGEPELAAERAQHPRRGKLENLINVAQRLRYLDAQYASTAHAIRRAANDVLHGTGEMPMKALDVLRDVRALLEQLFPE